MSRKVFACPPIPGYIYLLRRSSRLGYRGANNSCIVAEHPADKTMSMPPSYRRCKKWPHAEENDF